MEEKVFYRELNEEEKEEIKRLSDEAKEIIKFKEEDDDIAILNKIKDYVEHLDENIEEEIIEKLGYELGSLYGHIIARKYNWKWYYIEKEGEGFHCVASLKRRACCAVHNYYYSILSRQKNNNSILLFNMIKSSYPKDWDFTFLW